MAMPTKRRKRITELLRIGGAINRRDGGCAVEHPDGPIVLKEDELRELLHEGSLIVITCGCTGFWWALRPDLVAEYSL